MRYDVHLSPPFLAGKEEEYVLRAIRSGWLAPLGAEVDTFEYEVSDYVGAKHSLATCSGTAAIHLALRVLGVREGDEVLCSTFTFIGSVAPITYLGANPVFVGSEADTWNLSPSLLEAAIKDRISKGKKPKALVCVDLYGMPAKYDAIRSICDYYEIPIVEDAAEALGSKYRGRHCGTFGDLSIFSFNGNKIITTSGGGMLLSDNKDYIDRARHLSAQAREPVEHYEHLVVGYNYRMSNILAALGRAQLCALDSIIEMKRQIFFRYREAFLQCPGLRMLKEPDGCFSNRWLSVVEMPNAVMKERALQALRDMRIECRSVWKPMHLQRVFEGLPVYSHDVEDRFFTSLCLPSGANLSIENQMKVIETLKSVSENP